MPAVYQSGPTPEHRTPPAASGGADGRRLNALSVLALLLLAVLPYLNTLWNGFVYDDGTQVLNNPYILNFNHLRAIFSTTVWSYIGKQGLTNYYRPLMTVGYILCHELFGMLAYGYHLMNVSLYAGVTLLVFAVTEAIFERRDLAFWAAALFALEPVHSEAVAWIAGVTELEVAFFYLLAFWFFLRLPRPGGCLSDGALLGMTASFVLALLSKEQAVTLPALATFYEHACRKDRHSTNWHSKAARYGPLWLLTTAYLVFRVQVLGGLAPDKKLPFVGWPTAILSALALVAQYVAKLVWPARLCAYYVFHPSTKLANAQVIAGMVFAGAGLVLLFVFWKGDRRLSFALTWFIATLAPVLNARWMAGNAFTERYLMLPSIGFCWLAAWAGIKAWDVVGFKFHTLRLALVAAASLIAVAAAARIVTRNRDWRDDVTLYTKTLAQSPDSYTILNNLGTVYWREGRIEDARRLWERALQIRPAQANVLNNLGLYYLRVHQDAAAEEYFRQSMLRRPYYADPHLNLGGLLRKEEKWNEAALQLKAAIALSPLNPAAHNEMAKLDLAMSRDQEAETEFKKSISAAPNVTALDGLGEIKLQTGDAQDAKALFQRSLAIDPYDSRARFGLAVLDASAGLLQQAIGEYQAGLKTDPKNALALRALKKLKSNLSHAQAAAN
jgi:Tfp pilus assembly protein PilF